MTQPGGLGSNNVFQLRSESGRRGETSVASPSSISAPSDSPQHDHAAGLFHSGEGGGESFVCGGSALGGATGIGGWFICAIIAWGGVAWWFV